MVDVVEYRSWCRPLAPIADRVIGLYLLESGSSRLPTVPRRMRMHNRCVGHHGGRHAPSVGRRATIGTSARPDLPALGKVACRDAAGKRGRMAGVGAARLRAYALIALSLFFVGAGVWLLVRGELAGMASLALALFGIAISLLSLSRNR